MSLDTPSFRVTFLTPEKKAGEFREAISVGDAAAALGIFLEFPCGGQGTCGKCRVRYVLNPPELSPEEVSLLNESQREIGWRLACRHYIRDQDIIDVSNSVVSTASKDFGPPTLEGISRPRFAFSQIDLSDVELGVSRSLEDAIERALKLKGQVSSDVVLRFSLAARRDLGRVWNIPQKKLLVVHDDAHVFRVFPPSDTNEIYGLAFDLGTTTLACALVRLADGKLLDCETAANPQLVFGGDIISRITKTEEVGTAALSDPLRDAVDRMAECVCERNRVSPDTLVAAAAVGNPFILHSFCGVNPLSLGSAPFVPVWKQGSAFCGAEVGLRKLADVYFVLLPLIEGHVGADAVAAALALGMDRDGPPRLLIDLGTNCEVLLSANNELWATSAAAGPAFEGGSITCGMRAVAGAIDRVALSQDGRLFVHTISEAPPAGICGAGLIDIVALLRQQEIIDASGRLRSRDEAESAGLCPALVDRLASLPSGENAFVLAWGADNTPSVFLSATDVRQFQLIKASIRAAVHVLLNEGEVPLDALRSVYLAGQFGTYVRKKSILLTGLVPPVRPGHVQFVGNAAGSGCRQALVDADAWERAQEISKCADFVSLAGKSEYEELFVKFLSF